MILTLTQTVDNACASVALLNIVNNISNADLGEHLRRFKEFTRTFTPALRGDAIGNFEFIKQIHNSFARLVRCLDLPPLFLYKEDSGHALPGDDVTNTSMDTDICESNRKMDMLNGDLQLKNDASARKNRKIAKGEAEDSDAGYHFIAFVPVDGKVWKLDGLERQPQNLGREQTHCPSPNLSGSM